MSRASSSSQTAALKRFLQRLPQDVAESFSAEQLDALQSALQSTQWRRHPIDIRLSIPLLWKRFYVVVVGPERRSPQRISRDRTQYPIWTPSNLAFLTLLVSLGIALSIGLFQLKSMPIQRFTQPQPTHPTAVPFKTDRQSCEASGQVWSEGECLDLTHDANS